MKRRMPPMLRLHTAPAPLVSLAVILALAAAGVVAFGGSPAHAANVSCGDTITADTTLHHDLVNCPNNGVVIGANGITLDLNGHTIDGDGTPASGCDPNKQFCDIGVLNRGHDGVTIVHGSVRQFERGMQFEPARHVRVLDVSVRNSGQGILCIRCTRSLVRNSSESFSEIGSSGRGGEGLDLFFS